MFFLRALCLIGALAYQVVSGNVIGVDLGGEFMKVSVVQPGAPLEIVTNFASKRKTETIVTFYKGERFYASDALSYVNRVPASAFAKTKTTLGRDTDHPLVKRMTDEYLLQTDPQFNTTRSGIYYDMASQGPSGGPETYTPEEITAMILGYARDITKAFGGSTVRDAVLTVPSYWTQLERRAYLDAAELAGLKVLALVEENTAAALNFGMDRVHENATTVLFYNMGATATQVTVATYSSYRKGTKKSDKPVGQFEVVGKGWDARLGSHSLDLVLADYLAREFNQQLSKDGSKDVRAVPRAMSKLRAQANKVKEVLSANQEIPVFIPALHEDRDFSTHVSRSQLENLAERFFARAARPVEDALRAAGLAREDIHAVELIGGGVRTPKLQESLRAFFGEEMELGVHLNGDEAMAVGAAFRAANLSTAFKVRTVGMTDISPFAVDLELTDLSAAGDAADAWSKSSLLYDRNAKLDLKKKISFTHAADIRAALSYPAPGQGVDAVNPQLPEGTRAPIANYEVTGIQAFADELAEKGLGAPKVVLHFVQDASGLTVLSRAEATLEEEILVVPEEKEEKKEEEEKKEGEEEEKKEGEEAEEAAAAEGEKKEEGKKEEKKKAEPTRQTKVHRRALTVTENNAAFALRPMSATELKDSRDKLAELQRLDEYRAAKAAAKNNLESYVLQLRAKFNDDDDLALVCTEEKREELVAEAYRLEDWLYDEGYDEEAAVYDEKRAALKQEMDKVLYRAKELKARPKAVEATRAILAQSRELLAKWAEERPWVTEEERAEAAEKLDKVEAWLEEKVAEQAKLQAHEDPAFAAAQVDAKLKGASAFVSKLAKKPKPAPPKVEKSEEKSDNSTASEESEVQAEDLDAAAEDASAGEAAAGGEEEEEQENSNKEEL